MKLQVCLFLVALVVAASGHSIMMQLAAGGTTYPITHAIRDPTYDGPTTDVTTQYIACNGGPNPTTASPDIINVKAGDTIQATWRHTLTSTKANDDIYVIDPSHVGPVMAYMKKVTDATTDVGYGDGWFKIQHAGLLNSATQNWATTALIAANGVQNITIPSCLEDGQYLLRPELIALHNAGSTAGAQFYMECAQIKVSGGTGAAKPSTVALPGAYKATDPGILINIYYPTVTNYIIPGPTPFVCPAGGNSAPSSPSASSAPVPTTTATSLQPASPTSIAVSTSVKPTTLVTSIQSKTSTSSSKAASSSAIVGGAALYAQCGGTGWAGATTCASGTCKVSNPYFSQCTP